MLAQVLSMRWRERNWMNSELNYTNSVTSWFNILPLIFAAFWVVLMFFNLCSSFFATVSFLFSALFSNWSSNGSKIQPTMSLSLLSLSPLPPSFDHLLTCIIWHFHHPVSFWITYSLVSPSWFPFLKEMGTKTARLCTKSLKHNYSITWLFSSNIILVLLVFLIPFVSANCSHFVGGRGLGIYKKYYHKY